MNVCKLYIYWYIIYWREIVKLSSRGQLLLEAEDVLRKIRLEQRQQLNEGVIMDAIAGIRKAAESYAKENFEEYKPFLKMDKIQNDKPKVSLDMVQSKVAGLVKQGSNESVVNEGLSDILRKIWDVSTNLSWISGIISALAGGAYSLIFVKYLVLKDAFEHFSEKVGADGIIEVILPRFRAPNKHVFYNFQQLLDKISSTDATLNFISTIFFIFLCITLISLAVKYISSGLHGRTDKITSYRTENELKSLFPNSANYKLEKTGENTMKFTFLKNSKYKDPNMFINQIKRAGYKIKSESPLIVKDRYSKTIKFTPSQNNSVYDIEIM